MRLTNWLQNLSVSLSQTPARRRNRPIAVEALERRMLLSTTQVTNIHLTNDTGRSSSDKVTSDTMLAGTVLVDGMSNWMVSGSIDIDVNGDGAADMYTSFFGDSFFTSDLGLSPGEHTLRFRAVAYDVMLMESFTGDWTSFTLSYYPLPVVMDDLVGTVMNTKFTCDLTANDGTSNAPGTLVTLGSSGPSHGSVTVDGKFITYTPNSGFTGEDSFNYAVDNVAGESHWGVVHVNVSPVSINLSNGLPEDLENSLPGMVLSEHKTGSLGLSFDAPLTNAAPLQLKLQTTGGSIKLWKDSSKTEELTNKTWTLDGAAAIPATLFVEAQENGFAQVKVQLKNADGAVLAEDEVRVTVIKIVSVTFVSTGSTTGQLLHDNPDWAGGGFRFFPDQQFGGDETQRNYVQIQATVTPTVQGVTLRFRAYDIDDPSDDRYIDPNDHGGLIHLGDFGDDNRGQMGDAWKDEQLVGGTTDASGIASVTFVTSYQPGDNFKIGAADLGTDLPGEPTSSDGVVYTEVLTIWRKMHIETDRMTTTAGDSLSTTVTAIDDDGIYVQGGDPWTRFEGAWKNGMFRTTINGVARNLEILNSLYLFSVRCGQL